VNLREVSSQEIAQFVSPDLFLEVSRAEIDPLRIETRLLRLERFFVENLVDESNRDLVSVLSRSSMFDPVPELRARNLGGGGI
jgi:hypothetical protein